jgi:hypothetical protein
MPAVAATTNSEITMSKNRISRLVSLVVAAMIAGCAHKPVVPVATASQAEATHAPAAAISAISPSDPDDIIALGKRLTQNRLSLFSVARGTYTFYVGGVLNATYETATEILRISSLTPEEKLGQTCEYSPHGVLFVDPKDQAHKDALVNGCNQLVLRLNDYLSR